MKFYFLIAYSFILFNAPLSEAIADTCSLSIEGVLATDSIEQAKKVWSKRGFKEMPVSPTQERNLLHFSDASRELTYIRNDHGATIKHQMNSPQASNVLESRLSFLCDADANCKNNVSDIVHGKPVGRPQGANTIWRGGFERISIEAKKSSDCDYSVTDIREWKGARSSIPTEKAPISGLREILIYSSQVINQPKSLPNGVPSPKPHTSR